MTKSRITAAEVVRLAHAAAARCREANPELTDFRAIFLAGFATATAVRNVYEIEDPENLHREAAQAAMNAITATGNVPFRNRGGQEN